MIKKYLIPVYHYIFYYKERVKYKVKFLLWLKKEKKMKFLSFILRNHLESKYHILISKRSVIGSIILPHPRNVVIGDNVQIGEECVLYHDVTLGQNRGEYPCLKDNVIVYTGAKIIGGITVGNNAIIGANSVVTHDVPDNAVVAGIPAKIIKYQEKQDEFY